MSLTVLTAGVFQHEQSAACPIRGVRQAAMVDVHVVDLNRDRLAFLDRIRTRRRFRNVISDLFDPVGIAQIDHPDARVEVREPRDLVFEAVDLAVDGLRRLMRSETSTLLAEITD